MEESNEDKNQRILPRFQQSSFLLGSLAGMFLQLVTLGVNYLALMLYHVDILSLSTHDVLLASLIWSAVSATLSMVFLSLVRTLVTSGLSSNHSPRQVELWMVHLEVYFVAGTVSGVCVSWTVTDLLMGLGGPTCLCSLATLGMALICCRLLLVCFTPGDDWDEDEQEDEDQDIKSVTLV